MTAAPVVWWNRNPAAIARGYWDEGLLEDVFSHAAWRPACARWFLPYEVQADAPMPAVDGAVVVVAGQHNATPEHARMLNRDLAPLAWVVLVIAGDECSRFPWWIVQHPNLVWWVMTPRVEQFDQMPVGTRWIGEGYPPWFRALMPDRAPEKPVDWFFAGQVTHERREQCVEALRGLDGGRLVETEGFTQGLPRDEYAAGLLSARVAPCPSGACTQDSFRMYEALEAGAVPVLDVLRPGSDDITFWQRLYGDDTWLPKVQDWQHFPETALPMLLPHWAHYTNRLSAWWQQHKRDLAQGLQDDLDDLGAPRAASMAPQDQITVIVTSSPAPLHPSTDALEQTIDSIRAQPDLADVEIIVAFDGVRPEQDDRRADYEEYVRQACWLTNHRWHNVVPFVRDDWGHQANLTRDALELVRTPLVLFVEHDTPVDGEIPWVEFVRAIKVRDANVIRLHHEALVLEPHAHLMLDTEPHQCGDDGLAVRGWTPSSGFPALRTAQWSQRPHLASIEFYRWVLRTYFGRESRTMIEDVMHGVVDYWWRERGEDGWALFKLWLYAPEGDMKRSLHLDTRGADPKYDMQYAYPDSLPLGAPTP